MRGSKGKHGFYISIGVLALATIASGLFYKREADKAKRLHAEVQKAADDLSAIRNGIPTDEHKRSLGKQKVEIEKNFKIIVRDALRWNYVPQEEMPPVTFQGKMWETIGMVATAAEERQIIAEFNRFDMALYEYGLTL